jgi:DnaJ-class molecular chaperone
MKERKKKMKKTVKCPECEGKGYIPWGNKNDEIDECEVCEGHGEWLEDDKEMDMVYPQITDEEVDIMYEDYSIAEAIKERMRNDEDYRYA